MPKKKGAKKAPKAASAGAGKGKMAKKGKGGRRASVIAGMQSLAAKGSNARQDEQQVAMAMQKDYLAMLSGERVLLWTAKTKQARKDALTVDQIEGGVEYFTKGGTTIKWSGDNISVNDSTTIPYEDAVKEYTAKKVQMAEDGEEEEEGDEEVTVSLRETSAFGGMQLQEVRGAVYVRDFFTGGSAEKSEINPGWKVVAVKGMPFTTLFALSETYAKFKIRANSTVQFTFDPSPSASLFQAMADDSATSDPLGMYRAEAAVPYREHSEPDSTELGKLRMGDKISYTEACTDEAGQTSIKFCLNSLRLQDPQRVLDGDDAAWVSTANDPSGKPLVERLNDDGSDRNDAGTARKHGDYYRVLERADVRISSDPESKTAGDTREVAEVQPEQVLEVFESVEVKGVGMVRMTAEPPHRWVRKTNPEGGQVLRRILDGESMADVDLPTVVEPAGDAYMWRVFDAERERGFTVDASMRTVCRKELQVRTESIADADAVRVRIRKINTKKQNPKLVRNQSSIVGDVNDLQRIERSVIVKQDSHGYKKPIRSLMDLEHHATYVSGAGNTLERKDLQTATIGGRFDVPVVNDKGWVWMSRAKVHAATASTIHMLSGMMEVQTSGSQGVAETPRTTSAVSAVSTVSTTSGAEEPCMIFFNRRENTHPGTVKRMNSGAFRYCSKGAVPHLLVSQCKSSSEKFGEIEKGTWWQTIGKAAVRTGPELNTAKVGSLQPGRVIETLETQTSANGSVRVRFDTGKIKGWASVATADGNELMEEVDPKDPDIQAAIKQGEVDEDSDDEEEDDDGGSDPNAGKYRVVKKSVIRAKFDMNSPKMGSLEVDDIIDVSRGKVNSKTGQLRLKFDRGWTSMKNAEGVDLLERCEDLEPEPEPEEEPEEMDMYARMQAAARADEEVEDEDPSDFTLMEQYLDAFMTQELVCRYGIFESQSDDGKTLTMPAIALLCAREESKEHLQKIREKITRYGEDHPIGGAPVTPTGPQSTQTFEAGSLEITLKETITVEATSKKDPSKKKSVRYVLHVADGKGATWLITKSYTQFTSLDSTLRKALGDKKNLLAPLPSKHSKHKKDKEAVVAERKKAVESYVILATMHPMVAMHPVLDRFINSDKSEMEYTIEEEEEEEEGPNTVIEKIDGINARSNERDVKSFMESKEAAPDCMQFILEDDHKAFASKKLASVCNRLEDGKGATDMFLTPTVGRAVSRLMLWSFAHTWRCTNPKHERAAQVMYDLMERQEYQSDESLEQVKQSLADSKESGNIQRAFRRVCSKMERGYWDERRPAIKALIDAILNAALVQSDAETVACVLDLVVKMDFKRAVKRHAAWQDLSLWEGVLELKVEAEHEKLLHEKSTIAGDVDGAEEKSTVACKVTKELLLHMGGSFGVPKDRCQEFVKSSVTLVGVLSPADAATIEERIEEIEPESDEEEEIEEGVPPDEAEDEFSLEPMEEGEEEDEEGEERTPPDSPLEGDVHDGGAGLSEAEIALAAKQALEGPGTPGEDDATPTRRAVELGSAKLMQNSRPKVPRPGAGSESSGSDSDDSSDSDSLGALQSTRSSPRMMHRMNSYQSEVSQTRGSMARRASLAIAASGAGSPSRGGMGTKSLIDAVLTPRTSNDV